MPTLESLLERWPLTMPQTVAGAIVAVTVLLLGWQNWRWWGPSADDAAASADTTPVIAAQAENALPVLLSANLFGDAGAASTGATTQSAIVVSNTGLTLRAAFAAQGNAPGGAIIEGGDGTAHWYGLHETIPGGGVLQEIKRDHVVLNRGGNLERLEFPAMTSAIQSVVAAPPSATSSDAVSAPAGSGAGEPIPANLPAEDKARLIRQRLEELRNRSRT